MNLSEWKFNLLKVIFCPYLQVLNAPLICLILNCICNTYLSIPFPAVFCVVWLPRSYTPLLLLPFRWFSYFPLSSEYWMVPSSVFPARLSILDFLHWFIFKVHSNELLMKQLRKERRSVLEVVLYNFFFIFSIWLYSEEYTDYRQLSTYEL